MGEGVEGAEGSVKSLLERDSPRILLNKDHCWHLLACTVQHSSGVVNASDAVSAARKSRGEIPGAAAKIQNLSLLGNVTQHETINDGEEAVNKGFSDTRVVDGDEFRVGIAAARRWHHGTDGANAKLV